MKIQEHWVKFLNFIPRQWRNNLDQKRNEFKIHTHIAYKNIIYGIKGLILNFHSILSLRYFCNLIFEATCILSTRITVMTKIWRQCDILQSSVYTSCLIPINYDVKSDQAVKLPTNLFSPCGFMSSLSSDSVFRLPQQLPNVIN